MNGLISGNRSLTTRKKSAFYLDVEPALVGWWPLDWKWGVRDRTRYLNNGTGQGGINVGTSVDRYGRANRATTFDGTNDYVQLSAYAGIIDFSVCVWINLAEPVSIGYRSILTSSNWELDLSAVSLINAYYHNQLKSTFSLNTNQWYFVVLTRNNSGSKIYMDGVLNNSNGSITSIPNETLRIGIWGALQPFKGTMNDLRIYNRALSPSESKDLYVRK